VPEYTRQITSWVKEVARTPALRADEWLAEITTRKHDEDPEQLHLCRSTRLKYEACVADFIKPFFGEYTRLRYGPRCSMRRGR
jgi:hypothetical protein